MTKPKAQRLAELHSAALTEFDEIQAAVREERMQCLEDRRFYSIAGAQWEGPLGEAFENKPRLEFNKVHLAVIRIVNEYRNNRITVDFQPRDGQTDDRLADVCDGLYRADEQRSTANEAYDTAFEEGAAGGIGAWRLRACYEDEDDDDDQRQRIEIEPIFDADSTVFFDLGAKRQDKADAKRCYVLTPYTHAAYKEEFGDDPTTWPKEIQRTQFDWCTADLVWVCKRYSVEEVTELVISFQGLDPDAKPMKVKQSELDADPDMLDELMATGFREVGRKRVKRRAVFCHILSGGKVLEECGRIPGKHIPIVMFFGKRWVIDGVERCMGHVRLAKDAQRLQNLLMSWLAEMAARFDVEKPILTPEQIAGHAVMWAEDTVKKYPYLLINPVTDENGQRMPAGPVAYTKAPTLPPAMAALAQLAEQALQDLLGNQQAGEQLQPNMSGKAVELIQNRLDMQVFIYMSNLAKSMKRSGEIWLSMMRDLVVEPERRMKTVSSSGEAGSVVVNRPSYDPETASEVVENDLSKATFEVAVDVGPSSSSRRAATVRALTGMMQLTQDPETLAVLSGLAMMNMEGEGIADARTYYRRKMVRMGVIKPTDEEKAEITAEQQNAPPDPQSQYLMAAAEQAQADAAKKRADTVQSIASADLKRAQASKTLAETEGAAGDRMIATAQALHSMLRMPSGAQ
jgi:hypothetical protein